MEKTVRNQLWRLVKRQHRAISMGMCAMAVSSVGSLAAPMFVRDMIDSIATGGGRGVVHRAAIGLLIVLVVSSVFGGVRTYVFAVAGERVAASLRIELYSKVVRQDIAFFD